MVSSKITARSSNGRTLVNFLKNNIAKEQIIEFAEQYYKKYGKRPAYNNWLVSAGFPCSTKLVAHYFGNYGSFIEQCFGYVQVSRSLYDANPRPCKFCCKPIPYENRVGMFCDSVCSAKFNNTNRVLSTELPLGATLKLSGLCERCGKELEYKKLKDQRGYYLKRFCTSCGGIEKAIQRGLQPIAESTLQNLCIRYKNRIAARTRITVHSRKVYIESDKPKCCLVCGYSRIIDVAHINPVSGFSDETLVGYINRLDNLVALCPTHHREFDMGLFEIQDGAIKVIR